MKDLNRKRAELIFNEYGSGECSIVVTDILKRCLKNLPSLVEYKTCKQKGCPKNTAYSLPVLGLDLTIFVNNMNNLEEAITANLPNEVLCEKCHNACTNYERKCEHHLFIEVISILINVLRNHFMILYIFYRFRPLNHTILRQ